MYIPLGLLSAIKTESDYQALLYPIMIDNKIISVIRNDKAVKNKVVYYFVGKRGQNRKDTYNIDACLDICLVCNKTTTHSLKGH